MSSIFISVINLLTEALFNKVCDYTANKLKEGDLTDEKCRQLIVRELDDIKSKLDGLARRDLLSSVSFLSDGICLLHLSLDKSDEDASLQERSEETVSQAAQSMMMPECNSDSMHSESSIVNEALLLSHKTLTIASKMRFISAKSSFEKAYTKATEAFSNEALSTEDRILATKLRVVSKILECLEDPDAAAASCKIYLQQLHDLPAVRKIFSVHFRSGVKSRFNKTKRKENVRFVMMINYLLFHYTKIFTKTARDNLFNWPKIKLSKRSFHPLLVENDIVKKIEKSGVHPPNQFRFCVSNDTWAEYAAVNGKGEVIVKSADDNKCLHIITNKGEIQSSLCFSKEDTKVRNFEILALATNGEDDVYSVSRFKGPQEFYYKLSIFDASTGNVKQDVPLECLRGPGESHHSVCIAVNNNNDILITKQDEARVYVLDSTGQLKHSFVIETWHLIKHLTISDKNEIIVAELIGKAVGIYTEDGTFKKNIEVPGLHKVCGLAFNHVTKTIIVLTEVMNDSLNDHQLENYSETGEQLQTLALPEKRSGFYKITSHPNGPVAVVHKTGVIFIQH